MLRLMEAPKCFEMLGMVVDKKMDSLVQLVVDSRHSVRLECKRMALVPRSLMEPDEEGKKNQILNIPLEVMQREKHFLPFLSSRHS